MDARFHELAGTGNEVERRAGLGAWVILFLLVFGGSYVGTMVLGEFFLDERYSEIFKRAFGPCWAFGWIAGWPAIICYRMRALFPIRCVSYLAVVFANVLIASHFYSDLLEMHIAGYDPFIEGTLVVMGLFVIPFMQMEVTVLRAQYLCSEKTEQWLRYHSLKKGFFIKPEELKPKTVEDVLALEVTKRKWLDKVSVSGLFLDSIQDGEHYFCTIFPNKQKFFSLNFSQPKVGLILLPVDWQQVEQLRERFGEFKKTRFIPILSARAGNELRKLRKQKIKE